MNSVIHRCHPWVRFGSPVGPRGVEQSTPANCIGYQDSFEGGVGLFNHAICHWVVGGGVVQSGAEELHEGGP